MPGECFSVATDGALALCSEGAEGRVGQEKWLVTFGAGESRHGCKTPGSPETESARAHNALYPHNREGWSGSNKHPWGPH